MNAWINKHKQALSLIPGLAICLFFFLVNPLGVDSKANTVLAFAGLMIGWWVLDAMPLPVVALLPLVLFPLFSISSIKETSKAYSDSVIYLFMGGFFLGLAIEKWNLHKRIALHIINLTGTNGDRIILGFILATGALSMWLSNTATTMMMFPIGASVIHVISQHAGPDSRLNHFSLTLMLALAYAANFGGIATIIGTPPNVAYLRHLNEHYKQTIAFADWMKVCMPLSLLLLFTLYVVMVKWLYPNRIKDSHEARAYIKQELRILGPLSVPERRVMLIFGFTALLWITKDLINEYQHVLQLDDTIIALCGAISLFLFPSGKTDAHGYNRLLAWEDTSKMAWGILLLFGGGIALAKALEDAKLIDGLGHFIAGFATGNILVLIFTVTLVSVFLSEIMSNVAQVIVLAPVVSALSDALHINPLLLGIPMTLGASCAGMLPMGTPPNAIVFASGHIRLKHMLTTGFVLNLICVVLITLFSWQVLPHFIHLR